MLKVGPADADVEVLGVQLTSHPSSHYFSSTALCLNQEAGNASGKHTEPRCLLWSALSIASRRTHQVQHRVALFVVQRLAGAAKFSVCTSGGHLQDTGYERFEEPGQAHRLPVPPRPPPTPTTPNPQHPSRTKVFERTGEEQIKRRGKL